MRFGGFMLKTFVFLLEIVRCLVKRRDVHEVFFNLNVWCLRLVFLLEMFGMFMMFLITHTTQTLSSLSYPAVEASRQRRFYHNPETSVPKPERRPCFINTLGNPLLYSTAAAFGPVCV